VSENADQRDPLVETLSTSPIGSPESRAAARFLLRDRRHPVLVVQLVRCKRDPQTGLNRPDRNFNKARIQGTDKTFTRNKGESLDGFEERVIAQLPVSGSAPTAIFEINDRDEPPAV